MLVSVCSYAPLKVVSSRQWESIFASWIDPTFRSWYGFKYEDRSENKCWCLHFWNQRTNCLIILEKFVLLSPDYSAEAKYFFSSFSSSFFLFFFFFLRNSPQWAMASSFTRFLDHTQRRTTVGRTPPDEWSARRRDYYLTTHNTHKRRTPMSPVGFEPTISAGERPQTYAIDRVATGMGEAKYLRPRI